jgi:ABC-type iron transport system FetAB ATPase subunit
MPIDVACRICIGAELSGKLSPLEDYDREITWIEHDLAGATERLERYRKELSCLTQDKAVLDEQVSEEMKSRQQRSEERKAQIEALKTAKFNCRQLMLEIMRNMPAAALQGDAHRFCTQSDLKAQIKRLQEVCACDRLLFAASALLPPASTSPLDKHNAGKRAGS